MFPTHNPAQQAFNWHCRSKNISESNFSSAAADMREHVYRIRKLYDMPIGRTIPYDDADFRAAYLLAYFPYYIEPICHVLEAANLPDSLFATGTLNAAFFGGGLARKHLDSRPISANAHTDLPVSKPQCSTASRAGI